VILLFRKCFLSNYGSCRWKQRDIHEKRELRKQTIAKLHAQIDCNNVILPRITSISNTLADPAPSTPPTVFFNSLAERLEKNPSRDCPSTNDPTKFEQTYDGMILSLLKQVSEEAKIKVKEAGVTEADREEKLAKALANGIAEHVKRLKETIDKDVEKLVQEEKEQKKHITSEDLHDGFASTVGPSSSNL
jgi:cell division cycle protein 37